MPQEQAPTFAKHHATMVVGFLDIVGSTELMTTLSGVQIDDFYKLFLSGVSETLRQYGAAIIKNVGDGILFYFPQTTGVTPQSLLYAVECSKGLLGARARLNEALQKDGLPAIEYRVSMSLGPVSAMLGEGRIVDLFGAVVSTCSKMNKLAKSNTTVVGEALNEQLLPLGVKTHKVADYTLHAAPPFGVYEILS